MDPIQEWTAAQQRVIELVSGLSEEQAHAAVPACPDWSIRELLSHMVGLGADVLDGDEPDDHNSVWTQGQVDKRADRDIAALIEEWQTLGAPLTAWMREHSAGPLGDVAIHEQDLRGALRVAGAQDSAALADLRDTFVEQFGAKIEDLPPIALIGDSWTWTSRGNADDAETALQAGDFDLGRALLSRRSAAQLRGWTVRGDIGPYLDAFTALGDLPSENLTETF